MSLYKTIGAQIKEHRLKEGLSQEQLAKMIGETPNTISRWESATYKPSLEDLERLSRALNNVTITHFLPQELVPKDRAVAALLRSAKSLEKSDLNELTRFADFLRARNVLKEAQQTKKGRTKA
jgi:transcriptional regulator with XRE-family HTH domain